MDRLIRWNDVWKEDLPNVESPFFAASVVRGQLHSMGYVQRLSGRTELLIACSLYTNRKLDGDEVSIVTGRVESGEWLLLKREALSPIRADENVYAKRCRSKSSALFFGPAGSLSFGPGKWKIMDVSTRKIASSAAFFGNFLASLSDEGRVFLSDGKDYANTTRVVTQKWIPLGDEELYIAAASAIYKYGEVKETVQIYVQGDDAWEVSGSVWYWRPVIADEVYELK